MNRGFIMILGLPFPTYLGWFVGPIATIATAAFCVYEYVKHCKNEV